MGFLFLCATFVVRFYGVYGYLCDSEAVCDVWFWWSDKPCPKAEAERRLLM